MFKLCLFGLDQTLVETASLKDKIHDLISFSEEDRLSYISEEYSNRKIKPIFSQDLLNDLKTSFPDLKFGVFTRTPRKYAAAILKIFYPEFTWDVNVCYEDVKKPKPDSDGINCAMNRLKITDSQEVLMVGYDKDDMYAAINAGVRRVLITKSFASFKRYWSKEQVDAYETIPDAVFYSPKYLEDAITNIREFIPTFERACEDSSYLNDYATRLYCLTGQFREMYGDSIESRRHKQYKIYIAGRYYTDEMYKNHSATKAFDEDKDKDEFDMPWTDTFLAFLLCKDSGRNIIPTGRVAVTTIPSRRGQIHRMEKFGENPVLEYDPPEIYAGPEILAGEMFAYSPVRQSDSKEAVSTKEVKEQLVVKLDSKTIKELIAKNVTFVIVEEVCTTGASLVEATVNLKKMGVPENKIVRFAFMKTIETTTTEEKVRKIISQMGNDPEDQPSDEVGE